MKYDGDFSVLVEACNHVNDNWRVDADYGNAFTDDVRFPKGADTVESVVHELAHWFSLGHRARPHEPMVFSIRKSIDRMSAARRDAEEARAIAIEIRALELLGLKLSHKDQRHLISFASGNMSVTTRAGERLVRDYVVRRKDAPLVERYARKVARVVGHGLKSLAEEST